MESLHTDVRVQGVNIYADGVLTLTCCSLIVLFLFRPPLLKKLEPFFSSGHWGPYSHFQTGLYSFLLSPNPGRMAIIIVILCHSS